MILTKATVSGIVAFFVLGSSILAPAPAHTAHPALLRLRELDTLRELAQVANARIYIGFDKHVQPTTNGTQEE